MNLAGCADVNEFIYNSFSGAAHASCTRRAPADYEGCESRVNRAGYGDYQRERARLQSDQRRE